MTPKEQIHYLETNIEALREQLRAAFYFKNSNAISTVYGRLSVLQGQYYDMMQELKKDSNSGSNGPVGSAVDTDV